MLAYGFNPTSPDTTGGNLTKVPSMNLPGISADDSLMLLRAATLSIGVTESRNEDTPTSILDRVDQLLYDSKRGGKNRVTSG
ncbi:MAG TPA: hypothetical protein DD385_11470 [Marinobacter sp.]|jgi:PleD family two-component response regulator|nr:hypothetical protein [Marinobacter sp.]